MKETGMVLQVAVGFMLFAFLGSAVSAGYNIQSTALPESSALYNHLNSNVTLSNELKDVVDNLAEGYENFSLGPALKVNTDGTVNEVGTASNGASELVITDTVAVSINGVLKYCYPTAEILAWQSGDTLETGEACIYVAVFDGSDTNPNTSVAILQGAEVDVTTETALYPAITANKAPICAILVKSTDTPFIPSTTQFNATGVTTTFYSLIGPVPSGTSSPAAITASDLSLSDQ